MRFYKFLLLIIFFPLLIFAQTKTILNAEAFFSVKKTSAGFFIGVEIIDAKTKIAINDDNLYNYFWRLPTLFLEEKYSSNNLFFYQTNNRSILSVDSLPIRLRISKFLQASANATFTKDLIFANPMIQIVKISNNTYMPISSLDATINQDDILTVLIKNFSSGAQLNYAWELNNLPLSQKRDVPASLIIDALKKLTNVKSANIKVKVVSSNNIESAADFKQINIQ